MKKLIASIILVLTAQPAYALCNPFFISQREITNEELKRSRNQLKAFGFAYCMEYKATNIYKGKEREPISNDIGKNVQQTKTFYHWMNRGVHVIYQNEDTFEIIRDPYEETIKYIESVYDSYQKSHVPMTSGCLDIYGSKAFDDFIAQQDWLICYRNFWR
ncbi:MAG: hypothetical protein LBO72_02365 [Helicobacteraceae bacterium]|nr:hypothetical protein [Helicobacteraceae bacterium]